MFSFCVAMAMVCTPSLCEEANKRLFEHWGTILHIPEITLGVPADKVVEESFVLLDEIYDQLVESTRGELTSLQRELDVPFAMGMIEGIRASQGDEISAELCLKHLSELECAVSGWSASRLWRMRLHAHLCLKMDEEVRSCIKKIDQTASADIEDQLVASLCSKQVEFSAWDRTLALQKRNDLRWFFACGVVAQNPDDVANVFSVADDLVKLGVNRRAIDVQLVELLERIEPPFVVAPSSKRNEVALLARRAFANACLEQKKYILAKEKLLELTESDCAFSAQQLLTTPEIELQQHEANNAIELVLQKSKETSFDLSYWQLFSGSHFARVGNKNKASEHLILVTKTSRFYEDAQAILKLMQGSDVRALQTKVDQVAKSGKSVVGIVEQMQPEAAQQLLQQYVDLWHAEGIMQNPWLSNVVVALLNKTTGTSPAFLGEANRLLGRVHVAKQLFEQSNREQGASLQAAIGIADCNRDPAAMRIAARGLVLGMKNDYWFWLAHSKMIRWYCEDGGDKMKALAKVNRLKQLDPNLGGEQFAGVFREVLR
jgi:hypothetical protein